MNGKPARAALRLRSGDRVRLELPPPRISHLEPEPVPLRVVHEDADLVVLDKPAGLVVHPGAGVARGTVVHGLLHLYPENADVGGPGRPGIVHRLDKDTSGLMVVARSTRAHRALVAAIRARAVHRGYQALVWGVPRRSSGWIESAIGRDPRRRQRMAVVTRGGKQARTRFDVVERFGVASRLEVRLDTGRTHQIRVHLAHLGHSVVGDATYGGRGKKGLSLAEAERSLAEELLHCLPRQALHAERLELDHPWTGEALIFVSPWPDDFRQAVQLLRDDRAHED